MQSSPPLANGADAYSDQVVPIEVPLPKRLKDACTDDANEKTLPDPTENLALLVGKASETHGRDGEDGDDQTTEVAGAGSRGEVRAEEVEEVNQTTTINTSEKNQNNQNSFPSTEATSRNFDSETQNEIRVDDAVRKHEKHQILQMAAELRETQTELLALRAQRKEEQCCHDLTVRELKRKNEALEVQLAAIQLEMNNIGTFDNYKELILRANPSMSEASYLLRLQAQLSKSIHRSRILETQLALLRESSEHVNALHHEEITEIMEDKCKVEVNLMNELAMIDREKSSMQAEYDRKIVDQYDTIQGLKVDLERLRLKAKSMDSEKELMEIEYGQRLVGSSRTN